jgi:hypothetical protein
VETAGNRNLETRTYRQEIQLIQFARIWQTGRVASIDAGACELTAWWVRRWVHWGVHWSEHCNGSWIGWFLFWLLVFEGHYGWRNLTRTRGHPLVARLWIEKVLKFQLILQHTQQENCEVQSHAVCKRVYRSGYKSKPRLHLLLTLDTVLVWLLCPCPGQLYLLLCQ